MEAVESWEKERSSSGNKIEKKGKCVPVSCRQNLRQKCNIQMATEDIIKIKRFISTGHRLSSLNE